MGAPTVGPGAAGRRAGGQTPPGAPTAGPGAAGRRAGGQTPPGAPTAGPGAAGRRAGGQTPLGAPTRGTTNPNRLRRVDAWIAATLAGPLRQAGDPLVVDLGYGASPVTTVELRARLVRVRPEVRVV